MWWRQNVNPRQHIGAEFWFYKGSYRWYSLRMMCFQLFRSFSCSGLFLFSRWDLSAAMGKTNHCAMEPGRWELVTEGSEETLESQCQDLGRWFVVEACQTCKKYKNEQKLIACSMSTVHREVQGRSDVPIPFSFPTPPLNAKPSWLFPPLIAFHQRDVGLEAESFNRRRAPSPYTGSVLLLLLLLLL